MYRIWICFGDADRPHMTGRRSRHPFNLAHIEYCGEYVKVSDIDADGDGKARRDHPDTSKAAAKTIGNVGTQRRKVWEMIYISGRFGMTDERIAYQTGFSPNSVRPRRVELVEGGHVKDSGLRRKTLAGREAIVWVTT